jgi:hypothetical protein
LEFNLTKGGFFMKRFITIMGVMILLISTSVLAQDYIAPGYSQIFDRNTFETAPYPDLVADEVHAGFDLDKDGNLEFIVLTDHTNPNGPGQEYPGGASIYVYEWNGSDFALMWSWAGVDSTVASFPTMAVADLDGDTDLEIVLGSPKNAGVPAPDVSPTVIYIFEFGTGGGPADPTATWTTNAGPGTNTRPAGMAAGDIDGDGAAEVAVAFRSYSTASTNDALMIFSLNGQFAGPFTQFNTEVIDTTGDWGSVYSVDITDVDNDGNLEAYYSTDYHTAYEATGPDTYVLRNWDSDIYPWTIQGTVQADVDGDGNNELLFGKYSTGHLGMVYGVTDWATADSTNEVAIALVEPGGCRGMTAGDYDGDGNTDIFFGGNYSGSVHRIEYNGTGDIADSTSYTYEKVFQDTTPVGGARVYSVSFPGDNWALLHGGDASTDMNGNGEPEFLIGYEDGDSLQNYIVMVEGNGITGIDIKPGAEILKTYTLHQNYPNPFNPSTSITYDLSIADNISLKVYDLLGQEVKTLVNGDVSAGSHTVVWNGTNNSGSQVASGIYIYTLQVGSKKLNKRMTLLR